MDKNKSYKPLNFISLGEPEAREKTTPAKLIFQWKRILHESWIQGLRNKKTHQHKFSRSFKKIKSNLDSSIKTKIENKKFRKKENIFFIYSNVMNWS